MLTTVEGEQVSLEGFLGPPISPLLLPPLGDQSAVPR